VNKEALVEELSKLTVLEMAELKTMLEEKWGVKAQAAAVVAAPAAGDAAGGEAEEASTEFQVVLTETPGDKKIAVIKVVREVTGLGLKEAKELVESVPGTLKELASKVEAEEIKKKVEETGAKVQLKGL